MEPQQQPRYRHNCLECVFLGTAYRMDLYLCINGRTGQPQQLVLRYGNGDQVVGYPYDRVDRDFGSAFLKACYEEARGRATAYLAKQSTYDDSEFI